MKETQAIYRAVRNLAKKFGDGLTPEGVLVGALGEVLAEQKYDLELLPPKTQAFDAVDGKGRKVEIRCSQGNSAMIKKGSAGGVLLVLKLLPDGTIEEVFNGPASVVLGLTLGKKADRSGSVRLAHSNLRKFMGSVPTHKRVPLRK